MEAELEKDQGRARVEVMLWINSGVTKVGVALQQKARSGVIIFQTPNPQAPSRKQRVNSCVVSER